MVDDLTPNLKLHYLFSHQSQKEIFINKNFKLIDDVFSGTNIDTKINNDFRVHVVISDAGHIISNFGSATVNAYAKSKGFYSVEMVSNESFDRSKSLFVNVYVNDKVSVPYIANTVFFLIK